MKAIGTMMALLLLTISVSYPEQDRQLPPQKIAAIERLVASFMAKHKVPGLSVAIVVDGEPRWSGGYGLADAENQLPAKAATVYRTASIGKTMTATAAMQLVEQHKLILDADIQQYCPAFPRKEQRITPRHLLSHLSGIRHYGGPRDREEQSSTKHYETVAEALMPFKDDPLLFQPGTEYRYSTYGYDVLGCVIEGAANTRFLDYMKRNVWDPSGMSATRDDDPSVLIPWRARGYILVDGKLRNALMVDMSNRMAAGGYVTTVEDLAKFAVALMSGRLVSEPTLQQMMTPAVLTDGKKVPYGLGWAVELEEWHSDTWASHGGSSPGASGMLAIMPRHRFAVATLTNLEDLPDRSELAASLARIVLGLAD